MKTIQCLFSLVLFTAVMISCTKEDAVIPPASFDPVLKAPACSPNVINYNDRDTFNFPPFPVMLEGGCFPEPIIIDLYDVKSQGHTNVSASCRFNDHATLEVHITATGFITQSLYDSYTVISHHYVGSMSGQGAEVTRNLNNSTLVNLTTGQTYVLLMEMKQTINANGDVTVDEVEFLPCE